MSKLNERLLVVWFELKLSNRVIMNSRSMGISKPKFRVSYGKNASRDVVVKLYGSPTMSQVAV